jgi:hypothetical protein
MFYVDNDPPEGRLPAALAILAALACFVILAGVGLAKCSAPSPVPLASPAPAAQAAATASTAATASQAVRVTIRRPTHEPHAPYFRPIYPHERGDDNVSSPEPHAQEEIVIEVSQAIAAGASSQASASVPVIKASLTPDHARLGVIVASVPGAIAITYQVADVEIPSWVLGTPLELGLDVEGNLSQVGGGISVGGKAFIEAGGFVSWEGPGWYVGLGMRF